MKEDVNEIWYAIFSISGIIRDLNNVVKIDCKEVIKMHNSLMLLVQLKAKEQKNKYH